MTLQEFAAKTDMDLEGTLDRFANMEALAKKFLKKFPSDKSFQELSEAVASSDYATIERAAHTLKGVAGNLGFHELFDVNQKLVDAVRNSHYDQIPAYFEKDRQLYDNIIACVGELD